MTVAELIELLEDLPADAEVRLATQPSWPMEYSLGHRVAEDAEANVVYLAERTQLGYLSGDAAEQLGWAA
jgi:hypothetical protein